MQSLYMCDIKTINANISLFMVRKEYALSIYHDTFLFWWAKTRYAILFWLIF